MAAVAVAVPLPLPAVDQRTCVAVGCRRAGTSTCGHCRCTRYCTREHQAADWPRHKLMCEPTRVMVAYASGRGAYLVAREACARGDVVFEERAHVASSRLARADASGRPVSALEGVPFHLATQGRGSTGFYLVIQILAQIRAAAASVAAADDEAVRWSARFAQIPHTLANADVTVLQSLDGVLPANKRFARASVEAVARAVRANAFALNGMLSTLTSGEAFFENAARANHACRPNALVITIADRIYFVAVVPIAKNAEVTVSYLLGTHMASVQERRAQLLSSYGFACACEACALGLSSPLSLQMLNELVRLAPTARARLYELMEGAQSARAAELFTEAASLSLQALRSLRRPGPAGALERELAQRYCGDFLAQHSAVPGGVLRQQGALFSAPHLPAEAEMARISEAAVRQDGLEGWTTHTFSRIAAVAAEAVAAYGAVWLQATALGAAGARLLETLPGRDATMDELMRVLTTVVPRNSDMHAVAQRFYAARAAAHTAAERELGEEVVLLWLGELAAYGLEIMQP